MTPELYWTTLTVLMTALLWVPYVLDRLIVRKPIPALLDTKPETGSPHSGWAKCLRAAHANTVENLAVFVPAVLIAHALNLSTPATQTAAMVYFFARLSYAIMYTFGIPILRTLSFLTGVAAQLVILFAILGTAA